MKRGLERLIILVLVVCLVPLAGCGGPDNAGNMPMGRYVEDILDLPDDAGGVLAQFAGDDGSLNVYAMDQGKVSLYVTKNGESWEKKETGWQLADNLVNTSMAVGSNGEIYIAAIEVGDGPIRMMSSQGPPQSQDQQEGQDPPQSQGQPQRIQGQTQGEPQRIQGQSQDQGEAPPQGGAFRGGPGSTTMRVYKVSGNSLEEVDVNWATGEMGISMMSAMMFLENGDMVAGQYGVGIAQYGPDGTCKRTYGEIQPEAFTVSGNKIYICETSSNSILVYDGETFDQEAKLSFDSFTLQTSIAAGLSGAVYLYNSNGVFRLLPGGSLFEKIIDGDLTSLSMPNNFFQGFTEVTEGEFFIASSGDGKSKLHHFTYDPNIAARPENELVVFTLNENRTLRQAAGIFQKMHPDTKVNIQVGMGDDGATVADITRVLNTEIMAGNGPDIIMLDGLNAGNYIDKGVFLDVTDLVDEESSKEQMVESVLKAFDKDGKIYAVPAKFTVPLIFADAKNADAMKDIGSLADFAAANPDIGIIGDKTADNLLKVFLPGSMPGWLSGKEINEEKLAEYFGAIKTMADTPASVIEPPERMNRGAAMGGGNVMIRMGPAFEVGESNPNEIFNFAFGNIHAYVGKIASMRSLMGANMACERRGDCVVLPLPGLSENVYIPSAITGINAKGKHIDIAKDFLRTMLSKDVQSVKLEDGFAVNVNSIRDTMETENNFYMTMANATVAGEALSGGAPSIETQEKVIDLCLAVKTPYLVNNTLAEMILDEARGYFDGDKDLERAIADIRERTKIYLAE
ncbi:MAG: extracellular solute-binding protein [Clostridiales bacterium]|nr:extracellular solute-binding protein [Clostridiales bacterium]